MAQVRPYGKGIDISSWQGDVNFKRVRDEGGVQYAILRSGWGTSGNDPKFDQNAQAMVNLGIKGGIYHFSYAYTEDMARQEGIFAVGQASKYWKKCYICFDLEYDSINNARKHGVEITKPIATQYAILFLKEVAAAGYIPVLYLNQDYWNRMFDVDRIQAEVPGTKIWYANWYNSNKQDVTTDLPASMQSKVDIWQYSSSGTVPGIGGRVDMDAFYCDPDNPDVIPQPVTPSDVTCNINVKNFQHAANVDGYSKKEIAEDLVEDGIDGPLTQKVRKSILLTAKYKDGGYWVVNSTGETVKWLQTRLTELGFKPGEIDGLYGQMTRTAVCLFQSKYKLACDGMAGYNTLTMLLWV